MVEEIGNDGEFESFIKSGFSIIDFFAEWCMPCVMMAPVFEEISEKIGKNGKIKFGKVNIDDNSDIARKFNIMSIPCFILFKDGKEVDRIVGSVSAEQLEEKIKSLN